MFNLLKSANLEEMNLNVHFYSFLLSSILVSLSFAKKEKEGTPSRPVDCSLCHQCGGNGYMKTNPNCYHTCLECLGRGVIPKVSK